MMKYATHLQESQPLRLIKGYAGQELLLEQTIEATWQIAYTALWNGDILSSAEISTCKKLIKTYLLQGEDLQRAYAELAQRIMLARIDVQSFPGRTVPMPSEWFNVNNENGFQGTKSLFAKLQFRRLSMPLYKIELKAFCEAVMEMTEEPTARNFHYWREYFIERGWQGLLNVFLATVANSRWVDR
jgi:hypothetical protein